jgi:hypothetical protein
VAARERAADADHAAVLLHHARRRPHQPPTWCTRAPRTSSRAPTAAAPFARFVTPHGDNHDLWVNPRDGG